VVPYLVDGYAALRRCRGRGRFSVTDWRQAGSSGMTVCWRRCAEAPTSVLAPQACSPARDPPHAHAMPVRVSSPTNPCTSGWFRTPLPGCGCSLTTRFLSETPPDSSPTARFHELVHVFRIAVDSIDGGRRFPCGIGALTFLGENAIAGNPDPRRSLHRAPGWSVPSTGHHAHYASTPRIA
jgi:hypothetical protein